MSDSLKDIAKYLDNGAGTGEDLGKKHPGMCRNCGNNKQSPMSSLGLCEECFFPWECRPLIKELRAALKKATKERDEAIGGRRIISECHHDAIAETEKLRAALVACVDRGDAAIVAINVLIASSRPNRDAALMQQVDELGAALTQAREALEGK